MVLDLGHQKHASQSELSYQNLAEPFEKVASSFN